MVGTGLALNYDRRWEVRQLFPHLKNIISKYRPNLEVTLVADSLELDGAFTESDEEGEGEDEDL